MSDMNSVAPRLSICIPTYSRAELLEFCLATVLPQVAEFEEEVECVVCDNGSPDHTPKVIETYARQFPFLRTFRNHENIGVLGNFSRVVSEHAKGEYVWLIGDDDAVTVGAVGRVLAAIRPASVGGSVPGLIALNVGFLPREMRPSLEETNGGIQLSSEKLLRSATVSGTFEMETILEGPCADFTAVYSVVMLREYWTAFYPETCFDEPFQSVETTYPHAAIIADRCVDKHVGLVTDPSIMIFEMDSTEFSWAKYASRNVIVFATELLIRFQRQGVSRRVMDPYFRYQLNHRADAIGDLWWNRDTAGGFADVVKFAYRMKRFPIALAKALWIAGMHDQAPGLIAHPLRGFYRVVRRLSRAGSCEARYQTKKPD